MNAGLSVEARFYALTLAERALWRRPPSNSPVFAYKRRLVDAAQARWPTPLAPTPLPEIDGVGVSRAEFLEASDGFRRPVVLRGFARDARASRWTAASLSERLGEAQCTALILDEEARRADWDRGTPIERMTFAEYFRRMVDEPIYLNASSEVATTCPELLDELGLDRIQATFGDPRSDWDELVLTNFFIGSANVFSALHAAPAGNFFLNMVGRKRWLLTDPRHSVCLHPVTRPPWQYYRSAYGGYRAAEESGVGDILWRLPRYEVVLEPGDLLYNAPWWWHEVYNLDALTIGCAVRRVPPPLRPSPTWANHPVFTATSLYPVGRAAALGHLIYQRLSGDARPMRHHINRFNTWIINRTLKARPG